jgi:hypothetical protein
MKRAQDFGAGNPVKGGKDCGHATARREGHKQVQGFGGITLCTNGHSRDQTDEPQAKKCFAHFILFFPLFCSAVF